MNIEISTSASLGDAKQIDKIVQQMNDAMDKLNNIINNKLGPVGSGKPVSTAWADTVVNNWKKYYSSDIPETMNQIQLSATNLRMAVEKSIQYSNGK